MSYCLAFRTSPDIPVASCEKSNVFFSLVGLLISLKMTESGCQQPQTRNISTIFGVRPGKTAADQEITGSSFKVLFVPPTTRTEAELDQMRHSKNCSPQEDPSNPFQRDK